MKRILSGFLAWGTLAFIIGVPSAQIITNNSEKQNIQRFLFSAKDIESSEIGAVGYSVNNTTNQNVRVVGDPRMARGLAKTRAQIITEQNNKQPILANNLTQNNQSEIEQEIIISKFEPSKFEPKQIETPIIPEPALDIIVEKPPIILPRPSPVKNKTIVSNENQKTSVATVVNIANQQPLKKVDFLDLVAARNQAQTSNATITQNIQPKRQRLDIANKAALANPTSATQSEFYQYWQTQAKPIKLNQGGSFLQQLPATRGNAIRLDLIDEQG